MIDIGISHPEYKAMLDLLAAPHSISIRVRLLDLDHNYLDDLTEDFVSGQVNVDASADISRSLDLTLFDPTEAIHLDPDSPSKTSIFITDMIQILFVVQNPTRTSTYVIPVFTGPIDSVQRDDIFLSVKCLGKEVLSITNLWRGRSFKKTQEKTWVIKQILLSLMGETKMSIPDKNAKLPNDMHLNRSSKPWLVAKRLAKTMGFQLFYDGRGIAVMRRMPTGAPFTFSAKYLTSSPQVQYDMKNVINAVEVTGKKPKKGKHAPKYTAIAPRAHPLSPWRLGRGGVPRYLWTTIQDDSLTSVAECRDLAKRTLAHGLLAGVDVKFDGIPVPVLQEMDIARVNNGAAAANFRAVAFTIPLVAGDDASYGYIKSMRPRGGRKPNRTRHGHGRH